MSGPDILGVDIGRVIIDGSGHPSGDDTAFFNGGLEDIVRTPPVPGMLEVLPGLVERFGGRVWLVSKCGERVQQRTLAWLEHHRFYERTGIAKSHARFCRRRADKADHCRELGITHFVDDHLEVHEALRGIVPNLYLFGPQAERPPDWLVPTPDWPAVAAAIASPSAGRRSA